MKHGSLRASLLMICIFAAQAVAAQCPEGKSEVVVVTPSGVSKNICVAQAAIPGIENAANNEVIEIVPVCPCVDVWTGVYSDDVAVTGTPPILPASLTGKTCDTILHAQWSLVSANPSDGTQPILFAANADASVASDVCIARSQVGPDPHGTALLVTPLGDLFPQEIIGNGTIDDPRLEACRQLLVDRGCTFN